jgi:hypothetical protein
MGAQITRQAAGSVNQNSLPSPSRESTPIDPPWRSTIRRHVVRPSPVPGASESLPRWKGSKIVYA